MAQRRFPVVPIIATILQIAAVLLFLLFLYQAIQSFGTVISSWKGGASPYGGMMPPVTALGERLKTLISPLLNLALFAIMIPALIWGFADLFSAAREIEFNTRVGAGLATETPAVSVPASAPPSEPKQE